MNFNEIYSKDIFANNTGVILEELNEKHAIMSIKIEKHHLNAGNVAHGGVIYLLADISLAAIANQNKEQIFVSIQSDIRFLAPTFEGDTLTAEATEVYFRKRMTNCRVIIKNQKGETVAIGEGMLLGK